MIDKDSEFTGKSAAIGRRFDTREAAAAASIAIADGSFDPFLTRALCYLGVKPVEDAWLLVMRYNYPEQGEVSP